MEIPTIDLDGREAAVAAAVDEACRSIGFLVVTGHGVAAELIQSCFAMADRFFAQPIEEKRRWLPPAPDVFRGYEQMGTRLRAAGPEGAKVADYKETYMISRPEFDRPGFARPPGSGNTCCPNIWPDAPDGFRALFTQFYAGVEALAHRLNRLFAIGLGLPADWFEDKFDNHASTCTWIHYPAQAEPPAPGQMRIPAHTDSTSLTIVAQDDSPGPLEVMGKDGAWHALRPPPGGLVVNLGDLMAQWTNDRWVSTLHRVDNPPRAVAAITPRRSLAYFQKANFDAEIRCLETCVTAERPARYAPISAGDYVRAKMLRTRIPAPEATGAPS